MERIIDRFDKYMCFRELNDNVVTRDLSFSVGLIGKSRKEGRDLSRNAVDRILNFYTDINPIWLVTGEGSMLRSAPPSSVQVANANGVNSIATNIGGGVSSGGDSRLALEMRIEHLEREVEDKSNYIVRLQAELDAKNQQIEMLLNLLSK